MDTKSQRLISFLHSKAQNYDLITQNQKEKLEEINCAVEKLLEKKELAREILKENTINISNIVKIVGCSNKTLYNNKILIDFCNYLIDKEKKSSNEYRSKYKNPDEIIENLKLERDELLDREIENIELRKKIYELEEIISRGTHNNSSPSEGLIISTDYIKSDKSQ